ncbi:MAG: hypothetical protein MRJ96_13600 [Nitrospirales bacterium]|nr:hypothetical protein [Nitrospira sp.]MDR4502479.1 hypothetical protein [Nitrospirales bacterium]
MSRENLCRRFRSIAFAALLFSVHGLFLSVPCVMATSPAADSELKLLLPGEHIVLGTVEHVKSGVIQVNIGQLEPVFLSLEAAAEKGITSIQRGDKLKLVISDQDQFIDFHKAGYQGWDWIVKGHLLQPLIGDLKWALIKTEKGTDEPYTVDEEARHTVMNIPVGVPAMFLLNGQNIIIDATFGDEGELIDTLRAWAKERERTLDY